MVNILGKISNVLDYAARFVTSVLMIFLTILIFCAVLWRYAFNNPITWQYETTLLCLSWVIFIGMSLTFEAKEQMSLTFITNPLSPKVKAVWLDVIDFVIIVFLLIGIKEGIAITKSTWGSYYNTIPVRKGLFYLAFPIGSAISIVHLIFHILTRRPADFSAEPEAKEV